MKKQLYYLILIIFLSNCTSHTEETSDTTNTIPSNGKTLEVEETY